MHKKYFREVIKPILLKNGYFPEKIRSISNFKKNTETGLEILINMQKNRYRPCITMNISVSEITGDHIVADVIADYRLGEFGPYSAKDIWWSIEESEIEKSFQDIRMLMEEYLLPELEKWESQEFINEFLKNQQINDELWTV